MCQRWRPVPALPCPPTSCTSSWQSSPPRRCVRALLCVCVCVWGVHSPLPAASCARLQSLRLIALFLRPPLIHSTLHTRGQAFTMNPKLQATALTAIRSVHPTIGKSLFTAPAGAPVASVGSSLIVDVGRCVVSPCLSPSHCLTYRQCLAVFVSRSLARIVEASRPGALVCVCVGIAFCVSGTPCRLLACRCPRLSVTWMWRAT